MKDESSQPLEEKILLLELVRALVDSPEAARVDEQRTRDVSHMLIRVSPGDRGKVIGRSGATVTALRVLFGRIGAVEGRKIFIRVDEPQGAVS
jgi:predicted RNA-binding protein YlqC (UPF0109 family)